MTEDAMLHQAYVAGLIHCRRRDWDAFGAMLDTLDRGQVYVLARDWCAALGEALPATDAELEQHALDMDDGAPTG